MTKIVVSMECPAGRLFLISFVGVEGQPTGARETSSKFVNSPNSGVNVTKQFLSYGRRVGLASRQPQPVGVGGVN